MDPRMKFQTPLRATQRQSMLKSWVIISILQVLEWYTCFHSKNLKTELFLLSDVDHKYFPVNFDWQETIPHANECIIEIGLGDRDNTETNNSVQLA